MSEANEYTRNLRSKFRSIQMSAMYKCKLVFRYSSKRACTLINKALSIDNYQFVMTKIDNKKLVSNITSRSISSLLHTLEDYLNCVNIAEKVANVRCSQRL